MSSLWLVAGTEGCLSETDRGTEVREGERLAPSLGRTQVPTLQPRLSHHLGAWSVGHMAELNL